MYSPKIKETTSRNIQSKAVDINEFPINQLIKMTKRLKLEEKQNLLDAFG